MKDVKRFWGLHFDFHADNEEEIGIRTNEEDIERYVLSAKPDYIQCDCKGHGGNCSYPTKLKSGKPADKLVVDNLRIWSNVAKKHNIPLFVHYSGVYDMEYCKAHPEEEADYGDGNKSQKICLFGNYVHDLLIPQMKELITEYGIAGCWIDGDCWAVAPDYSEQAKPFLNKDMTKREKNQVMHDAFLRYVNTYTDELHAFCPDFKVISNWAYTSYIPEKQTIALDFISGDFPYDNSPHVARYEGRCIALRDVNWDLMAWGFELHNWGDKSATQLMQEAAVVLSLGGGFQVYVTQNRDGSVRRKSVPNVAEIGAFMREREFLYGKKPLAQTAIYYDAESYYTKSNVFNAAGTTQPLIGAVNAVLDSQYTTNVIYDYQLDRLSDYDIVVIPEWEYIKEENKNTLISYVEKGGKLLVMGINACRQFGEKIGLTFGEVCTQERMFLKDKNGAYAAICDLSKREPSALDLKKGTGNLYNEGDDRDALELPAYRTETYGKGSVTFIPFAYASEYFGYRTYISRNFLSEILSELATPLLSVNRKCVDLTLQPSENGMYVNLVNMLQNRQSLDYGLYDGIPEIYGVELKIAKKYKDVRMPLGEKFTWEITDEGTIVRLEKLEIHSVIEFVE